MKASLRSQMALVGSVCSLVAASASAWAQSAITDNDVAGYRQLQAAAYRDDTEGVERFAGEGAPLEVRDPSGRTPVIISAHRSADNALTALVNAGASISAKDDEGHDALSVAVKNNDTAFRDLVVSLGYDLNAPGGPRKDTILGIAAREGNVELVQQMITLKADLDFVNAEGDTPLLQTVKFGDGSANFQKIVQLLIDAGAKKGRRDADGLRARQYARDLGYDEILEIFKNS